MTCEVILGSFLFLRFLGGLIGSRAVILLRLVIGFILPIVGVPSFVEGLLFPTAAVVVVSIPPFSSLAFPVSYVAFFAFTLALFPTLRRFAVIILRKFALLGKRLRGAAAPKGIAFDPLVLVH